MNSTGRDKVGVILVHGIGEQGRFEHLEAHARELLQALISREERTGCPTRVSVEIVEADGASFQAQHASWVTSPRAAIRAHVRYRPKDSKDFREIEIHFHEVWYADLGERYSFLKQIRFWAWGLSMWAVPRKRKSSHLLYRQNMTEPKRTHSEFWVRGYLFMLAYFTLLATFPVTWILFILNRLGFRSQIIRVIINYISMIRIYDQRTRSGGNPLDSLNDPPRTAVRRRMVRTIFDVYMAGYSRWYILGHSLGSVVAFNGLMEPDEVLPNYLDSERWERVKKVPSLVYQVKDDVGEVDVTPPRPIWIGPREAVSRNELFKDLRGFLTYGCPLDKFAALWPAKVAINKKGEVFRKDMNWINVYDKTDPVAGHIDSFPPPDDRSSERWPVNLCYRASPWMLLSHIKYLAIHKRRRDQMADRCIEWILSGDDFERTTWLDRSSPEAWARWLSVRLQWFAVTALLLVITWGWIQLIECGVGTELPLDPKAGFVAYLSGVFLLTVVAGIAGRTLVFRRDEDAA